MDLPLATEPAAAEDPWIAGIRLGLALGDRDLDAASSIAAALPLKQTLDAGFNQGSRDFWLGMIARLKGDTVASRAAFTKVRTKLEEQLRIHPDNMDVLSDLIVIHAA